MPRNVAPDVNELENAYLYDVDDLQSVAADNLRGREEVARDARVILESEVQTYLAREKAEDLRRHLCGHTFLCGIDARDGSRKKPFPAYLNWVRTDVMRSTP